MTLATDFGTLLSTSDARRSDLPDALGRVLHDGLLDILAGMPDVVDRAPQALARGRKGTTK